jgi:hypothetical protein
MAQAVRHRTLTAEARFRTWVSTCGICGGQSGIETGTFLRFPLSVSFHRVSPYPHIIWGTNNRPVYGRSSETKSHHIEMNSN